MDSTADILEGLGFVFIVLGVLPVALSSYPLFLIIRGRANFWLWPCLALLPGGVVNILLAVSVTPDYLLLGSHPGSTGVGEFMLTSIFVLEWSVLIPLWLPAYLIVRLIRWIRARA